MGHESLIMQQSDINSVADAIKDCPALRQVQAGLRDARAARNLLYSPRNKILATSLLVEAFLYEEQTRRGVSIRHFERILRRRGSLHRVPQVRDALPRRHRLRRRVHGHARPAAAHGQEAFNPATRPRCSS
jgi:hypothetical protein